MDCSKCKWGNPDTCRNCRAEELDRKAVQIVATRPPMELIETDPEWWELHLLFRRN